MSNHLDPKEIKKLRNYLKFELLNRSGRYYRNNVPETVKDKIQLEAILILADDKDPRVGHAVLKAITEVKENPQAPFAERYSFEDHFPNVIAALEPNHPDHITLIDALAKLLYNDTFGVCQKAFTVVSRRLIDPTEEDFEILIEAAIDAFNWRDDNKKEDVGALFSNLLVVWDERGITLSSKAQQTLYDFYNSFLESEGQMEFLVGKVFNHGSAAFRSSPDFIQDYLEIYATAAGVEGFNPAEFGISETATNELLERFADGSSAIARTIATMENSNEYERCIELFVAIVQKIVSSDHEFSHKHIARNLELIKYVLPELEVTIEGSGGIRDQLKAKNSEFVNRAFEQGIEKLRRVCGPRATPVPTAQR